MDVAVDGMHFSRTASTWQLECRLALGRRESWWEERRPGRHLARGC
jgi:hypothetical protein